MSTGRKVGMTFLYFILLIVAKIALMMLSPEQQMKAANSDAINEILQQRGLLGVALIVAVIGPILEELVFRLGLYRLSFEIVSRIQVLWMGISEKASDAVAFLIAGTFSAVVFGWLHGETSWTLFIMHTMSGFFLAHLYFKTRTLAAPIAVHMLNNALPVLFLAVQVLRA